MIDVRDVSKSYGTVQQPIRALHHVSFRVDAGEVIGLLGPNGAGKTTMIKILTGYLQPDDGQVAVDGLDVLAHPREVQQRIGYLPENAPLYPEMSVQSYLRMIAELREIPEEAQLGYLSTAVRATGLEDHLVRPIGELSKGFRQRVGLAQAILHRPKLLILDEPTVGLDPTQIVQVRRLIRRLAHHSTVLLSTHILSEVEATCDRVIILMNGEVKADAALSALSATADFVLILDASDGQPGVRDALRALPGVRRVDAVSRPGGHEYRIRAEGAEDLRPELYRLARDNDWPLRELRRDVRTLETVFNELATAAVEGGQQLVPLGQAKGGGT
jgi:ABC-2 type transport system ATP-binding protein